MALEVGDVIATILRSRLCWEAAIATDHNHVSLERHGDRDLWVHRKGAMPASLGEGGVLPGSMGSLSFHVEGRGHEPALCSSAHGAGRALSRTAAREKVTERELRRQITSDDERPRIRTQILRDLHDMEVVSSTVRSSLKSTIAEAETELKQG